MSRKESVCRFVGLGKSIPFDIPWVIVCLETVTGPRDCELSELPKEVTIATPHQIHHYVIRLPSHLAQYDVGYNVESINKKRNNNTSPISLRTFNMTFPLHIDKARVVFGYGNIPLIERVIRRPAINMLTLLNFDNIFIRDSGKCNFHKELMPDTTCSRATATGLLEWCKINSDAICFTRLEPTEKPIVAPPSSLQDILDQLLSDISDDSYYSNVQPT